VAGDDVTITIRADGGQAVRAFRDVNGQLRDMRGRFVSEGATMSDAMRRVTASIGGVRGSLIPLAAAATPLAAALAPIAAKAAGAGVALAAFGAAVAGQASELSEASKAQETYNQAVTQYGRGSKQAAEAARAVSASLAAMPQATQRAAVQMQTLKDGFQAWSDEMAQFTMAPVEKGFAVLGQIVPKLTPMVKGTSEQLERLMDVAGGAISTPGFDALTESVSEFANSALQDAVDGAIHLMRVLSEGEASGGPLSSFMQYAEQNGPAAREALSAIGDAVSTLAQAAADAGPGMLTLVTAAAKLVAALPPELVTVLMQTAVALKLVSVAGAGMAAAGAAVQAFGARLAALQAVSVAAGGGMAGLAAAFGALSTAAKASVIVAGLGLAAVAISKLSDLGEQAPPNVDKLTTSLGNLGRTGKATGYVAQQFGSDFEKLNDQIKKVTNPSVVESINNWGADITNGLLDAGDATEAFTKNADAIDESLSNLVRNGNAELAKAALTSMLDGLDPEEAKTLRDELDNYDQALADLAFEQQAAADAMGIFGQAALDTEAKLSAQKQSADGLRASILALNDANRSAYDSQIQFEGAIDSLSESFKEHGSTLDLDTEAGRANAEAMSAAAAAHDEMLASGVAAGESLGSMTKRSDELRSSMMKLATEAFDGNKQKATEYVNTLLGMPGEIKTMVKLERQEATTGLEAVQAEIRKTPDAKTVTVETLNGAAIAALEAVGLKTKQLPDGKTSVSTANGKALGSINAVRAALNGLDGKTAHTYTEHNIHYSYTGGKRSDGATFLGPSGRLASGGRVRGYASGGDIQAFPDGGFVQGPGTGTSDDILALMGSGAMARVSNTEFVVRAAAVQKYGVPLLDALNQGRLKVAGYAKGGKVSKSEAQARSDARGDLTISHFGQMAGYSRSEFRSALGGPDSLGELVNSLNKWAGIIKKATHGGQEKALLKALDSSGKKLIAWEKKLGTVTASLDKAKDKLDSLKSAASQLADSVKGGVLSAASITRRSGDGPVTVASIMGGLTQSRDKATAFAQALKDLQSKGVASSLIEQIADAGIEGGGLETAGALLQASSSEIASMNSLQSQITSAATSAGKVTADAVYGKAIDLQTRLVNNLKDEQKKLTTSMDKLAGVMERMIEKAFKGKAAGGIVGVSAAASGGLRSNLTWVGEQGPELLDLPAGARVWSNPDSRRMQAQAWASMLNAPRVGAGGARMPVAVAPAGGGQPLVIQVRIGEREFGELWVDTGRKVVRARGGIEATLRPPRGR
jgi:hypothetical protein